jgi:hypothetical protein
MTVSAPYPDPYSQKRTVDWLVVERTATGAVVRRFTSRAAADAWLDHPELDTNDRELDARREDRR